MKSHECHYDIEIPDVEVYGTEIHDAVVYRILIQLA